MPERTLMGGNIAIGEGALLAGCQAYFGYPITPQNDLLELMARRMPELGRVFLQTESELAAINMASVRRCSSCVATPSPTPTSMKFSSTDCGVMPVRSVSFWLTSD